METKTLVFPITFPLHTNLYLLSIVFNSLKLLLPSEDATCPQINEDEYIRPFKLETEVPNPLGDKLNWFKQTLYAWESWASQIGLGDGISAINLVQSLKSSGESSIQDIIGSIKASPQLDELTEAQLFLALAHKFDQHEDQLSRELEELEKAQNRIKSLLKDPIVDSKKKQTSSIPLVKEPVNVNQRLRFWSRLFLNSNSNEIPIGIGLECQDSVERLYEASTTKSAKQIFWLPVGLECNDLKERKSQINNTLAELIDKCKKGHLTEDILNISNKLLELWLRFSDHSLDSLKDYIGTKLILDYFEGLEPKELFKLIDKKQYKLKEGKGCFCFFLV